MTIVLPDSFDDFLSTEKKSEDKIKDNKDKGADEIYAKKRLEWSTKVKSLASRLKDVYDIPSLQVDLYSDRQIAVEQYHYLYSLLIGVNKSYNRKYTERFKYYTDSIQFRVNKEQITNLINNDLETLVLHREKLQNHYKYMLNTISTIDNIIYGIKSRVEIEQIRLGG